jgi:hypothetical protein
MEDDMAVKPEDYLFSPLKMKQVLKNALLTLDRTHPWGSQGESVYYKEAIMDLVSQCAKDRSDASVNGTDWAKACSNNEWMKWRANE